MGVGGGEGREGDGVKLARLLMGFVYYLEFRSRSWRSGFEVLEILQTICWIPPAGFLPPNFLL